MEKIYQSVSPLLLGNTDREQRKLSEDEMHEILIRSIPLRERMDAVYIPILAQDCACYLCDDMIEHFRELRFSPTKKECRNLRECVRDYRDANRDVMLPALFEDVSEKSREVFEWIRNDIYIYSLQYASEILKGKDNFDPMLTRAISEAYVVRRILRYVRELDSAFSKSISEKLPLSVTYKTDDNEYCVKMDKLLTDILRTVGVPDDIDTANIRLSYEIFKNKINQYHIGYTLKELSRYEKGRYKDGFCRCCDCGWHHTIAVGNCGKSGKHIDTDLKRNCWRKCDTFTK